MKIKSYFSHHFFNMNLQQTIRRILREEFENRPIRDIDKFNRLFNDDDTW
jgi:hypothetical protein